jgi:hypothetical protein
MPGYNSPRRGTVRIVPITFLCCSMYCFFVLFYVLFVCLLSFCVLFLCKCVLYYCHRVSTQLQLTNISISINLSDRYYVLYSLNHSLYSRSVFMVQSTQQYFKKSISLLLRTHLVINWTALLGSGTVTRMLTLSRR